MKANESGTMGVAMTHTKKDVVDIAKQCPGDKFYMDCNPKTGFFIFNDRTGAASVKVPVLKATIGVACKLTKKALNGDVEMKDIKYTFIGIPPSVCKIDPRIVSATMKHDTTGSH
jgi:hypothetical protein